MLNQINPVATLGVTNIHDAQKFYEEKLQLSPVKTDDEEMLLYRCGNTTLSLYHSEFAGTNKATALSWEVGDDIVKEVEELKNKGVEFEHYDMPDAKLEGDIHVMGDVKAAWFKDPSGNILCITNHH